MDKGQGRSSILEYCRTDRQRQIIQMVEAGMSHRAIARELGCGKSTVADCVQRVREYATVKGVDPAHDCDHPVSDAYIVRGTSTLYDANGNKSCQWVKTTLDPNVAAQIQRDMANEFARTLPKYKPQSVSSKETKTYKTMLSTIVLADVHLSLLSWDQETGTDYDLEIAEKTIRDTITAAVDNSPACEDCLISNLGDFIHTDNLRNETERSGNKLDVDGRFGKIMRVAIRVLRYTIEYALAKHKHVTLANLSGNHDDLGALWLTAAMANVYEKEKRLTVMPSEPPRLYYRYHNNLICMTHGSDTKPRDLPMIMACERREDWGETQHHFCFQGHIHKETMVEVGDCMVESFGALCAKDAWSNAKGFMSRRSLKVLFFDPSAGEVERHTIVIK